MRLTGFTLKLLGLADIHWEVDKERVGKQFSPQPLLGGSCVIVNRASGLAIDASPDAVAGTHNQLWSTHGAPWQRWRVEPHDNGTFEIMSEPTGLRLTTMKHGFDWGETWLHNTLSHDWSKLWRLEPTEDRAAFSIINADSGFALDAGEEQGFGTDPHVWAANGASWQQWLILRLPLSRALREANWRE